MWRPRLPFGAPISLRNGSVTLARRYAAVVQETSSLTDQLPLFPDDALSAEAPSTGSRRVKKAAMRTYKPKTPGLRHLRRPINDHLWKGKPLKSLTYPKKGQSRGGRNNSGQITVRHRGGGHKRRIRVVDYFREVPGKHVVERIEYDPNRSAHLALIRSVQTDAQSYIIAAEGLRAGDTVESFRAGLTEELIESMGGVLDPGLLAAKTALTGNCLPMEMIPPGTQVHNIGITSGQGGKLCRSAGTYGTVLSRNEVDGRVVDVTIKLQSGEIRRVKSRACATIGVASNSQHHFTQYGKAGRMRWLGIRPTVRGVAMNAGTQLSSAELILPHRDDTRKLPFLLWVAR